MNFLRSLVNLGLAAIGAILGNLLAAWVLQDAWGNAITPTRLLATVAGFALVILILAWLDARAERRETATTGEVSGNVQIGHSVIRVLQGTNVLRNIQIGHSVIEVLPSGWSAPPAVPRRPDMAAPSPAGSLSPVQRDLLQRQAELQAQYQDLTSRIAAVDVDLTHTLDGEQKLVLEQRRAALAAQRNEAVAQQQILESKLPQ